jgi:hypothetical protein
VVNDPLNCGACGKSCGFGQACNAGTCTGGVTVLATNVQTSPIGIDADDVFYWASGTNQLDGIAKSGGMPFQVMLQNQAGGQGSPFAVSGAGLYYEAVPMGGGSVIDVVPPPPSTQPPTLVASLPSTSTGPISSLQVAGSDLLVVGQGQNGSNGNSLTVSSVPASGGSLQVIAQFANASFNAPQFAFDSTNVYAIVNCQIEVAPRAGGMPSTLMIAAGQCPAAIASDGTNVYWSTQTTSYSGQNGNQVCAGGSIYATPVAGGATTTLLQFPSTSPNGSNSPSSEAAMGLALSASTLYAYTGQSVWQIPTASGASATRLAGNLGGFTNGSGGPCTSNSGGGGQAGFSMIPATTDLYLAINSAGGSNGTGGTMGGGTYLLRITQ